MMGVRLSELSIGMGSQQRFSAAQNGRVKRGLDRLGRALAAVQPQRSEKQEAS